MNYSSERVITLAQARTTFGYTQDHLGYLCRKGYVWSSRSGRTWLTCEQSVLDYQRALKLSGRPMTVGEQIELLYESKFQIPAWLETLENRWNEFVGGDFLTNEPKNFTQDPLFEILKAERFETEKRKKPFVHDLLLSDVFDSLAGLAGDYKLIFSRPQFTQNLLATHPACKFALTAAIAPVNLPVAPLPRHLKVMPWYAHELVLVPACAAMMIFILNGFWLTL